MTSLVLCECYTSLIIRGVPLFGCCMLLQVPIVGSCSIFGVLYVIVIAACCTPSLFVWFLVSCVCGCVWICQCNFQIWPVCQVHLFDLLEVLKASFFAAKPFMVHCPFLIQPQVNMVCWLVNQNCFIAEPFMAHSLLLFGLIQPKLVVCWLINHNCFIASSPISRPSHLWFTAHGVLSFVCLVQSGSVKNMTILENQSCFTWSCPISQLSHLWITPPHWVCPLWWAGTMRDHNFLFWKKNHKCFIWFCPTLRVKTGKRGQAPQLPVPRCAPTFQTPFFHAPFPGS